MGEITSQKARYSNVEEFIQGERGYLYYEEEYDQNKHKKGNAWEYDLKFEFDHEALHQFWKGKDTVNCKKWIEELNDLQIADPLVRFLKYKNQPEGDTFDCDGSGEEKYYKFLCKLSRDIFKVLWGWQGETLSEGRYKKSIVFDIKNYWGPESMNSYWITYCSFLIMEHPDSYEWNVNFNSLLFKDGVNGKQRVRAERLAKSIDDDFNHHKIYREKISKFAFLTHSIGNFCLVPAGFNSGRVAKTKDYWDLSLDILKKEGYKNNKNVVFEIADFNNYINTFFLWDYVDKYYNPKSLFSENYFDENPNCVEEKDSHSKYMRKEGGMILPEKVTEVSIFLNNVNRAIKCRGIFMVAMLKISVLKQGDYCPQNCNQNWNDWQVSDIYKEIMDKVFLADEYYSGFNKVFKAIEKVVSAETEENQSVKKILEEAKSQLKK